MAEDKFLAKFLKEMGWTTIEDAAEKGTEVLIVETLFETVLHLTMPPILSRLLINASKAGIRTYRAWSADERGIIRYTPRLLNSNLVQVNATKVEGNPPLWIPKSENISRYELENPSWDDILSKYAIDPIESSYVFNVPCLVCDRLNPITNKTCIYCGFSIFPDSIFSPYGFDTTWRMKPVPETNSSIAYFKAQQDRNPLSGIKSDDEYVADLFFNYNMKIIEMICPNCGIECYWAVSSDNVIDFLGRSVSYYCWRCNQILDN